MRISLNLTWTRTMPGARKFYSIRNFPSPCGISTFGGFTFHAGSCALHVGHLQHILRHGPDTPMGEGGVLLPYVARPLLEGACLSPLAHWGVALCCLVYIYIAVYYIRCMPCVGPVLKGRPSASSSRRRVKAVGGACMRIAVFGSENLYPNVYPQRGLAAMHRSNPWLGGIRDFVGLCENSLPVGI